MLALTKADITEARIIDNNFIGEKFRVDFEELETKSSSGGFQGACQTSSKEWEDFNVHKAFNKTLITAYKSKNMRGGTTDGNVR